MISSYEYCTSEKKSRKLPRGLFRLQKHVRTHVFAFYPCYMDGTPSWIVFVMIDRLPTTIAYRGDIFGVNFPASSAIESDRMHKMLLLSAS
jgi:hypothetical protein